MAMPPGNVVISDKVRFPSGGGGGGNEIHQQDHRHPHQWFPVDERDGFISWLRGEFAAANAIIDSLCHHLQTVGEYGEYDSVIGWIQQRRCNWNPVLHMQQYFSVGEVILALQQVVLRKQQRQQYRYYYDQPKAGVKEFKKSSNSVYNKGQRGSSEAGKEVLSYSSERHILDGDSSGNTAMEGFGDIKSDGDCGKLEDKALSTADDDEAAASRPLVDNLKISGNSEGISSEVESDALDARPIPTENDSHSSQKQNVKQNVPITPETFVGAEIVDGKMVNVVEGMRLYKQLLGNGEISELVSLVNDLRAAGRKGQLQGQTYVLSKRPMKGHGREMIQLGLPMANAAAEEEKSAGSSRDWKVESIPTLLQEVIERLIGMQLMAMKPDCCIIDIYNEGDHSQPTMWPPWYGKPIYVVSLTECDLTFGRVVTSDHPGDYRGSLKLSLAPGSLLVMEGKSADFAKHALPAIREQRILVTFTKSQPKRNAQSEVQWLTSPAASLSHWVPPPNRSSNHIRHTGPKHYAPVPTTGVLPAPSTRPQMSLPNGVQTLYITAPIAAPIAVPAPVPIPPVSTGWPTTPARHPTNCPPGTGVFLPPPGSGVETATSLQDKQNEAEQSNHGNCSLKENGKNQKQDYNGCDEARIAAKC